MVPVGIRIRVCRILGAGEGSSQGQGVLLKTNFTLDVTTDVNPVSSGGIIATNYWWVGKAEGKGVEGATGAAVVQYDLVTSQRHPSPPQPALSLSTTHRYCSTPISPSFFFLMNFFINTPYSQVHHTGGMSINQFAIGFTDHGPHSALDTLAR